jgi:sRNA-binding regulator protein Hfq
MVLIYIDAKKKGDRMLNLIDKKNTIVLIFLKNGFKYSGKLLNSDEQFVSIHDDMTDKDMFFPIVEIQRIEVIK